MKTKLIASALIALSMAASGSAFAQRNDHGNDRDGRNNQSYQRDNDHRDNNGRYDNDRRDARQYRLNQEYRGNRYVVSDWRSRHLSAPPRGHQWVQAGNDYVLAAIATGIIAQVLLSN
jgi:Ni/Co efflux regulator RcnB